MDRLLYLPGVVLVLVGVALSASFTLGGPRIPTTLTGWIGWACLLGGLLELKLVAALSE